jgi:hypothetical protein
MVHLNRKLEMKLWKSGLRMTLNSSVYLLAKYLEPDCNNIKIKQRNELDLSTSNNIYNLLKKTKEHKQNRK